MLTREGLGLCLGLGLGLGLGLDFISTFILK